VGIICVSISTVLYFLVSISCFMQKDHPHGVMWAGYTFANLGLLWYEFTKVGQ
jgi:hypothetical protein